MTTYTVQGPTGKSYTIEGPAGATADQLGAAILQSSPEEAKRAQLHAQIATQVDADPISQGAMSFAKDMPLSSKLFAGIGKGMTDFGRGVGERLGIVSPDDIDASRRLDAPLMATTAGKVGNFVGKAATMLPTVLIPGANLIQGAAAIGAVQGAVEPTAGDESVLKNAALGAVAGPLGIGAGKVLGAGVRSLNAAAEPLYQAGRQKIVGRALNAAAGADAPVALNQLEQAAAPFVGPQAPGLAARTTMGELVPGSAPNVGQAAQNPGIAALQRAAVAVNPDVTTQVSKQLATQNSARVNALRQMAGTDGERDFAAANRDATSDQLYGAARTNGVDPAALTPAAQANIAAMQARIPPAILSEARSLAQIQGMPMDDTSAVAGMHYVKQALDDAIASAKAAGQSTRARALTGLQKDYLAGLDNLSPAYAAARSTHAAMSEPINQMDVAQALLNKAQNPLTETLQPAAYARALNDKTAAGATGFNGATLGNTLTDQQQNLLQSILADLRRSNAADNAGRGAGSDTVQKLAYANMLNASGVPNVLREFAPAQVVGNLASRGADAVYGRADRELSNQLAETMLSPADAAAAMRAANRPTAVNPLLELLKNPRLLAASRIAPSTLAVGSGK